MNIIAYIGVLIMGIVIGLAIPYGFHLWLIFLSFVGLGLFLLGEDSA